MTDTQTAPQTAPETRPFEAEVGRLLKIVASSLYSEREIFLRELVSNASDACDRLRYAALTEAKLLADDPDLKVTVAIDKKAKTLTITDNGLGMGHDELVADLGTIARSGTTTFVEQLSGDDAEDVDLIGQFGVGFYSSFMVADRVEVVSRKAGEDTSWHWESDGEGSFTVAALDEAGPRGTAITLHMRKDAKEFLESARLHHIIKHYSDHIALPIVLVGGQDGDSDDATVNAAQALWTRPKNEIEAEQYTEFYHHTGHLFDEPWLTIHNRVEGKIEYTNLLFVPSTKPFDLFQADRKPKIKLYVKRVFITDDCEELLPSYLRFLRGIVDSEDMPLNVSREMLQNNPVVAKIRSGLVKRVLGELEKKVKKAPEEYATFWDNFGAVMKEGIYENQDNRKRLIELCRAHSTAGDDLVSFADYVERMKEGQDAIYYITGDSRETAARSPQLEAFRAKGVEVLFLTDPVDEFWVPTVGVYQDKPFKSVTQGGVDLGAVADAADDDVAPKEDAAPEGEMDTLIALFKLTLGDEVKDVRTTERLTDSPCCLIADEGDMDMHLQRMLQQHQGFDGQSKRVFEINPKHPLVKALAAKVSTDGSGDDVADAAWLLLDQARIVEGEALPDQAAFARRLSAFMQKGLGV
jgi:molecular chaperone HtpG